MKKLIETLTPEVQDALKGIYVKIADGYVPLLQEITLTVETFGIIEQVNGETVLLMADDFSWDSDDGSDKDLRYSDEEYYSCDDLPENVVIFLNGIIGVKFAKSALDEAKEILDGSDNDDAKTALGEAITAFEEAVDTKAKLNIAKDALTAAQEISDDIDEDVIDVIEEVADKIAD